MGQGTAFAMAFPVVRTSFHTTGIFIDRSQASLILIWWDCPGMTTTRRGATGEASNHGSSHGESGGFTVNLVVKRSCKKCETSMDISQKMDDERFPESSFGMDVAKCRWKDQKSSCGYLKIPRFGTQFNGFSVLLANTLRKPMKSNEIPWEIL